MRMLLLCLFIFSSTAVARELTYYVDDGCQSDPNNATLEPYDGTYLPKSNTVGVRCCNDNVVTGPICMNTTGYSCLEENKMTYDEAARFCQIQGGRICTKNELLGNLCCGTGGDCDNFPVWTSTTNTIMCTDTDNGYTDSGSGGCDWYDKVGRKYCGPDDTVDFKANTMCCSCGGGITGYELFIYNKREICLFADRIGNKPYSSTEKCRQLCDDDSNCQFFFISVSKWCSIFSSCSEVNTNVGPGTTYEKTWDNIE